MKKIIAVCFVLIISALNTNAIYFPTTRTRHDMDFTNIPVEIYEMVSANEPDLIFRVLNMSSNATDTLHLLYNIHEYIDFYLNLRNQVERTVIEEKILIMWHHDRILHYDLDEDVGYYSMCFPYFILASGGVRPDENGNLVYSSMGGIQGRYIRRTLNNALSLIVPVTQNFFDDVEIFNVFIMLDGWGTTDQSNLSIYFETSDGDFVLYIENPNRLREELNLYTAGEFLIPLEDFLVLSELNLEQLQYLNPSDMAMGFVVPEIRDVFDLSPFLLDENGLWVNSPLSVQNIEYTSGINSSIVVLLSVAIFIIIVTLVAIIFIKRNKSLDISEQ
ncbi:MAG: hypothetical protein FWB84_06510 [Candidatus Bathyarchaeota archaeon]|uniref:hypothetical protein n=1 Tax=Candidatus Bathycorpusculum sp. TaxID=2994959 RepID=UPI00281FCEAC|nr:hypothetical protein [Candidatus Termiticorpusculum sp.]